MILDPISLGLVKSADSPGGQFTGTTLLVSPGKQIDALLQAAPAARRIGVLFTEGDRTSLAFLEEARQDARRLNAEIVALGVPPGPQSVRAPLERLRGRIDAVWLILDPASTGPRALAETLDWAREQRLPVLGASGAMVQKGALLALSPHLQDLGESTAEMAVYLLQGGAQTALMRVRGPRRTLLSVNLETARALDVKIPGSVLHLADEVVEAKGGRP
jgi:putative ABC transport system substrate-binding protein